MDQSVLQLLQRMLASMTVVLLVMWIAARLLKNRQIPGIGSTSKKAPLVQIISRQGLGKHASVNVVRTGDKVLVLGVTDQNINVLAELDHIDLEETINTKNTTEAQRTGKSAFGINSAASQTRSGLLTQIRELTVRKD